MLLVPLGMWELGREIWDSSAPVSAGSACAAPWELLEGRTS